MIVDLYSLFYFIYLSSLIILLFIVLPLHFVLFHVFLFCLFEVQVPQTCTEGQFCSVRCDYSLIPESECVSSALAGGHKLSMLMRFE